MQEKSRNKPDNKPDKKFRDFKKLAFPQLVFAICSDKMMLIRQRKKKKRGRRKLSLKIWASV